MLRTFCALAKFYHWSFDDIKNMSYEEYEAAMEYITWYNRESDKKR